MMNLRLRASLAATLACAASLILPLPGSAQTAGMVANGSFDQASPGDAQRPAAWGRIDGLGVQWTNSGDADHGKALRMDTRLSEKAMMAQWLKVGMTNEWNIPKPADNAVAETYGLSLYSDSMPVKKGQPYRVTFDFKGTDKGAMVWVRGYGQLQGKERRLWETRVDCRGNATKWSTGSQVFFPTKFRPAVTEMKVMLFAYYPAGVYWFDNIKIEPITEAEYNAEKR